MSGEICKWCQMTRWFHDGHDEPSWEEHATMAEQAAEIERLRGVVRELRLKDRDARWRWAFIDAASLEDIRPFIAADDAETARLCGEPTNEEENQS